MALLDYLKDLYQSWFPTQSSTGTQQKVSPYIAATSPKTTPSPGLAEFTGAVGGTIASAKAPYLQAQITPEELKKSTYSATPQQNTISTPYKVATPQITTQPTVQPYKPTASQPNVLLSSLSGIGKTISGIISPPEPVKKSQTPQVLTAGLNAPAMFDTAKKVLATPSTPATGKTPGTLAGAEETQALWEEMVGEGMTAEGKAKSQAYQTPLSYTIQSSLEGGKATPKTKSIIEMAVKLDQTSGLEVNDKARAAYTTIMADIPEPRLFETLPDKNLADVVAEVIKNDKGKLPNISDERLNKITNAGDLSYLWDSGYKPSLATKTVIDNIANLAKVGGIPVTMTTEDVNSLNWRSVMQLQQDLVNIRPEEWDLMRQNGVVGMTIDKTFIDYDVRGNPLFYGKWDPIVSQQVKDAIAQGKEDADYLASQQRYWNYYWSAEAVANRNQQREESAAWSEQKDLEGWAEYYANLDSLKMNPLIDNYFESPTQFAELRRRWQTSGSGMAWGDWLKQYDFKGEWYMRSPSDRGERPAVFAPRMRSTSY